MNTQVQFILTKNSKKSRPSQNNNSGGFMIEFVMSQENEHYRGGMCLFTVASEKHHELI